MKKNGISTSVFVALILVVIGFAGHGFYTFQKELQLMEEVSVEDIVWTSSQMELELARFRHSLLSFQIDGSGVNAADVNERFDILWSRIALFQQGNVGKRLLEYSGQVDIVDSIFDTMKQVDRQVVGLDDGDNAGAGFILEQFASYPYSLRELSRAVTLGEEQRNRDIRKALSFGVNRTMILAGLATGLAIFAIFYIYRQAVKARQLADVNRRLAGLAEKASRAKSQFLTMMSHELRTPMNGVIGLLAVVKQRETEPMQRELIETAEDSARKMLGLLADVFDYSALQSETVGVIGKSFEIAELAKTIHVDVPVTVSSDCPKLLVGDIMRLRQAFNHLSRYIVETAGTRDVTIHFDYEHKNLVMQLSFEYSDEGGVWKPDLILETDDRSGDKFATDALGPTLARGLVKMMGGAISVRGSDGPRIVVECDLPLVAFDVTELRVKILTTSASLISICRATIRDERIQFLDDDDARDVHMYLIESGDSSETEYLRRVQEASPPALLVALGKPLHAEAFDFAIEIPLDFQNLQSILLRHVA